MTLVESDQTLGFFLEELENMPPPFNLPLSRLVRIRQFGYIQFVLSG
jgi:hypothetical protein